LAQVIAIPIGKNSPKKTEFIKIEMNFSEIIIKYAKQAGFLIPRLGYQRDAVDCLI